MTTIVGNLTADPILRFTGAGKAVLNLNVAMNRRWQANGEWQESTTYMKAVCWGDLAENIAASCVKGTRVWLAGHFDPDEYESDDGKRVTKSVKLVCGDGGISLQKARATVERVVTSKPTVAQDESDVF